MNERLKIELVPETAWWSNVRSNVSRAEWELCKRYAKAKTNAVCIICGDSGLNQGWRYAVEAHEIWDYDDDDQVQTLVDIDPLCPRCHQCKHLGRSRSTMDLREWTQLIEHFQKVNDYTDWDTERAIVLAFKQHHDRGTMPWTLEVGFLSLLGIDLSGRLIERQNKKV